MTGVRRAVLVAAVPLNVIAALWTALFVFGLTFPAQPRDSLGGRR